MGKRKLNYRFHNPNPAAATADYILKVMLEANTDKVQAAIQNAANQPDSAENKPIEECVKLIIDKEALETK